MHLICVNTTQTKASCKGTWIESTTFCPRLNSTVTACESSSLYGCNYQVYNITSQEECEAQAPGACSLGFNYFCRARTFSHNNCSAGFYWSEPFCRSKYASSSPYACDYIGGVWVDHTTREGCESDSVCYRYGTTSYLPVENCLNCTDGRITHGVYKSSGGKWLVNHYNRCKVVLVLSLK